MNWHKFIDTKLLQFLLWIILISWSAKETLSCCMVGEVNKVDSFANNSWHFSSKTISDIQIFKLEIRFLGVQEGISEIQIFRVSVLPNIQILCQYRIWPSLTIFWCLSLLLIDSKGQWQIQHLNCDTILIFTETHSRASRFIT